jgi:hypothetical protein
MIANRNETFRLKTNLIRSICLCSFYRVSECDGILVSRRQSVQGIKGSTLPLFESYRNVNLL